jgi:hypothetical protein
MSATARTGAAASCFNAKGGSRAFDRPQQERIKWPDFRVEKIGNPGNAGSQFLEKTDPLLSERELKSGQASDISARPSQASDKTLADRIADTHEYDRDGARRRLQGCDAWRSDGKYHIRLRADQFHRIGLYLFNVGAS